MKVVELLDQASKDGPRGSLREQVGEHHDAGEVFDRDNATADEIAKELGGAQDVLGLLEGNGIEGHADGGFAVGHPTEMVVVIGVQMKQTVLTVVLVMTSKATRHAYLAKYRRDRTKS